MSQPEKDRETLRALVAALPACQWIGAYRPDSGHETCSRVATMVHCETDHDMLLCDEHGSAEPPDANLEPYADDLPYAEAVRAALASRL